MITLKIIWSFLTSRLGGWIVAGLAVMVLLGLLKWEHAAKIRAQEQLATAQKAVEIGYEGYVKLYQEREKIQAEATAQRRKLDELRRTHDYDGLSDTYNKPGGVRPPGTPDTPRGPKGLTKYRDSTGTEFTD